MRNYGVLGLILLLGIGGVGSVLGQEPDPVKVQRGMDRYIREAEAAEKAAARKATPKPRPKPVARPSPTVDHDREAWQSAEQCGTAACFEAYLEDYPKGRYAKMARAKLEPESKPESRSEMVTKKSAPVALPRIDMVSRPESAPLPAPARPSGGSVVGTYATQENAYALRDYYRSQNVRAGVEKIMVNDRPMYQVRVWR